MNDLFVELYDRITKIDVNFRFDALHILRGVAALSVCLFHTFYANDVVFSSDGFTWLKLIKDNGGLGVPVFFMISGYCISVSAVKNMQAPKTFLVQRVKRLYPAYWFSILFGLFLLWGLMSFNLTTTSTTPTLPAFAKSLSLLVNPPLTSGFNPSYWTLRHEIYFYFFIFILLYTFRKNLFYALDFITFSFLMLSNFGSDIFYFSHIVDKYFIFNSSWMYFYLGILLFRILCYFNKKEVLYHLLLLYISYKLYPYDHIVLYIFTGLVLIRPFDHFLKKMVLLKPLFFLGTISYSLYLLHQFITPRMRSVLLDRFQGDLPIFLGLIFVLLPLSFFIVYIFHVFFEKPFADHGINNFYDYKKYCLNFFKTVKDTFAQRMKYCQMLWAAAFR